MKIEIGEKYLVTTSEWFFGPDGEQYKAVFGTAVAVESDSETLGIRTNARSANWYLLLGEMLIAGCQIHYCIKCDRVSARGPLLDEKVAAELGTQRAATSRIYQADQ